MSERWEVNGSLVQAAIDVANASYAHNPYGDGWAGAATMHTSGGRILNSIFVEAPNDAATICMETGALA